MKLRTTHKKYVYCCFEEGGSFCSFRASVRKV